MRFASTHSAPIEFISLKDDVWLEKQRIAGKVAAGALILLEGLVKEKSTLSLLEMNAKAEEYICDHGCSCTFKGYKGFPAGVCISVNEQLVHGIPTDYHLQEGDLVSFDLGTTYQGAIADTAITCCFGETNSLADLRLIRNCEEALIKGIAAIQVGQRLGIIGQTIYRCARDKGYSVITQYGGHGISYDTPHDQPFVSNKASFNEGVRIQAGMVLALEPLFVRGTSSRTQVLGDGWTVVCDELCVHFEHTVYVHSDRVEIITARDNG
jgi:methionyl aminopeptidase